LRSILSLANGMRYVSYIEGGSPQPRLGVS
jgi:hypothetical protein